MRTIWKYSLDRVDEQQKTVPIGARILSVGNQNGNLAMWVEVPDTEARRENRTIYIVGTGNPANHLNLHPTKFIGTVIDSPFVWHVYEKTD